MRKTLLFAVLLALAQGASAQLVGATNRQSGGFVSSDPSPVYRPTGSSLRFSIGAAPVASVAYNYNPTSWFMVGGGVGLCMANGTKREEHYSAMGSPGSYWWNYSGAYVYDERDGGCIPLFVEAEVRTPRYKLSFFVNTKLGYIMGVDNTSTYGTDRTPTYTGEVAINYIKEWNKILFSLTTGVSYKNVSLGVGYAYTEGFNMQLSYNLPFSVITNKLL